MSLLFAIRSENPDWQRQSFSIDWLCKGGFEHNNIQCCQFSLKPAKRNAGGICSQMEAWLRVWLLRVLFNCCYFIQLVFAACVASVGSIRVLWGFYCWFDADGSGLMCSWHCFANWCWTQMVLTACGVCWWYFFFIFNNRILVQLVLTASVALQCCLFWLLFDENC